MIDTDAVLVVGGGPVGLSTAFFLAAHGVRPLVIEKRDAIGRFPRAGTSPRTAELFRSHGLGPALERAGWQPPAPYVSAYARHALGPVDHYSEVPPAVAQRVLGASPVGGLAMSNDVLERLLLPEIRDGGGEVRFGTRVEDVGSDDDGGARVTVVEEATGRREVLRARHVVGADGARSAVASAVGIDKPDLSTVGTLQTVMFRARLDATWPAHARFAFLVNDDVHAAIGSIDGRDQWVGHLMGWPGKTASTPALSDEQAVALLHAAIGAPVPIEVLTSRPWTAQLGLASAFRAGPVFLVGDAAHVQTSAGGLGMNTGIQDGHNLAWKLAAVRSGQASPALLDTYEAERRPAASVSVEFSRAISGDVGIGAERPTATEPRFDEHLRAMMFYGYESTAVVDDEGPDRAALDVLVDEVRPGHRVPHRWLRSDDGWVSTVDLAGPEWVLLTGSPDAWTEAAGVRVHRVDDAFRALAAIGPGGAVLVRPDGFVAWRSAEPAPERLGAVLDRLLGDRTLRA